MPVILVELEFMTLDPCLGGVYCENADIAEAVPGDSLRPDGVRPWAIDSETASRLWRLSEEWIGTRFAAE
ncbi:hypothetical protein [Paenibacillus timonensis]|uniref:hypothetical protein n=1 Tax=Paenibacillus timonensis TaxID=225915 RepID=UPI0036D43FCD